MVNLELDGVFFCDSIDVRVTVTGSENLVLPESMLEFGTKYFVVRMWAHRERAIQSDNITAPTRTAHLVTKLWAVNVVVDPLWDEWIMILDGHLRVIY